MAKNSCIEKRLLYNDFRLKTLIKQGFNGVKENFGRVLQTYFNNY